MGLSQWQMLATEQPLPPPLPPLRPSLFQTPSALSLTPMPILKLTPYLIITTFSTTITYPAGHAGPATLTVFSISAKDGSRINVVTIPVTLR